jgi:pimeloyl-ACP methyl ester carboxylesterase
MALVDLSREQSGHEAAPEQLFDVHLHTNGGVLLETEEFRRTAQIARTIVPYTLEVPKELRDPRPLVIVNGYGAKKFPYDGLRAAVAQLGKPAVSMHPYGFQKWFSGWDPRHLAHPEQLLSKAVWGVMRDVRENQEEYDQLDTEQFDLAGHSMGLRISTVVAMHKPTSVAKIINVQGVGCESENGLLRMIPRVIPFIKDEAIPAYRSGKLQFEKGMWHAFRSELDYFFPNFPLAMAEGIMAGTADNRDDLRYLKRRHGIGLAAIVGTGDNLIPAHKTVAESWGLFDHGVVLDGKTHLDPIAEPDVFAREIVKAIDFMNNQTLLAPAA